MKKFQPSPRFGRKEPRSFGGGFKGRDDGRAQLYTATCSECGDRCEVPFKPSGDRPVFCKNCFRKEDAGASRSASSRPFKKDFSRDLGRSSFEKRMYAATCDECGDECEVPFKPTGAKPVYCRNCFGMSENARPERRGRNEFDSRDFTGFGGNPAGSYEREMFSATCAECGDECEVPFKPTGEKPVYCRNCFNKTEKAGAKGGESYKKDFEQLNMKVDTLLRRLDMLMGQQPKAAAKATDTKSTPASAAMPEKKKAPEQKAAPKAEKVKVAAPKAEQKKAVKKPVKPEAKKVVKKVKKK